MLDQLVVFELAERAFAGSPGQAADFEEAVVAAESVEEYVGVGLAQCVAHDGSAEHGFGAEPRVAAVRVVLVELLNECAGARDNPRDDRFQEAVAAFRGLFVRTGRIRIDQAHGDF